MIFDYFYLILCDVEWFCMIWDYFLIDFYAFFIIYIYIYLERSGACSLVTAYKPSPAAPKFTFLVRNSSQILTKSMFSVRNSSQIHFFREKIIPNSFSGEKIIPNSFFRWKNHPKVMFSVKNSSHIHFSYIILYIIIYIILYNRYYIIYNIIYYITL